MESPDIEITQDPIEGAIVPVRSSSPETDDEVPQHGGLYADDHTPSPRSVTPESPNIMPDHAMYPPEHETSFPVRNASPESPMNTPVRDQSPRTPPVFPMRNRTPDPPAPFPMTNGTPDNQPHYPPRSRTPEGPRPFPVENESPRGPNIVPAFKTPENHTAAPNRTLSVEADTSLPARSLSTLAGHEEELDDHLSTKNTVLSYRTDRTTRTVDQEERLRARKFYRSAITHLLCGLYALVLVVLGLVFSISSALTHADRQEESLYLQIFQLYIFGVSLMFLFYVHCGLLRYRKPRASGSLRRVNLVSNNQIDQHDKCSAEYNHEVDITSTLSKDRRSRSRSHSDFEEVLDTLSHAVHAVTFDAEGINFYLRLGAIAFGTGSMIHDGFRIASLFDNGEFSLRCRGPFYVAVASAHMVFTFFQTFYIFKNHKIVINKHKAFVRFGFMHMVASNICIWCITTVSETAEDLRSGPTPEGVVTMEPNASNASGTFIDCRASYLDSLAFTAAPYLYPCTIEYSLIAAAVLYKMYGNVGSIGKHEMAALEDFTQLRMDCDKANKGLFLGILVAILTLIAVSCFFVFDQKIFQYEAGTLIFFGTELILLFLACAVVIVGFARMQKLRYIHDFGARMLDMVLIIMAFFGVCILNTFIAISALAVLLPFNLMALLSLATAVMAFVESLVQTVFIMDGLRRCARHEHHVHAKPGRALVTFLLLCNLSLWVVNTFEMRKADSLPMHVSYFGNVAWSMISHLCIPLIIFFRFHSTVCLSDIWVNAYKLKKKDN